MNRQILLPFIASVSLLPTSSFDGAAAAAATPPVMSLATDRTEKWLAQDKAPVMSDQQLALILERITRTGRDLSLPASIAQALRVHPEGRSILWQRKLDGAHMFFRLRQQGDDQYVLFHHDADGARRGHAFLTSANRRLIAAITWETDRAPVVMRPLPDQLFEKELAYWANLADTEFRADDGQKQ